MASLRQASLVFVGLLALTAAQDDGDIERKGGKAGGKVYFMNIAEDTKVYPPFVEATQGADGRIIGGSSVQPGELPFYGHFLGEVMCGGFLTEPDIFVTAAHVSDF